MRLFRTLLIVFLVLMCISLIGVVLVVDRLPRIANQKFGPPDSSLSLIQKTIYSYRLLSNQDILLSPLDAQGAYGKFEIELGESVNSISARLEQAHFIANADAFTTYLIYAGLDTRVQSGSFQLSPAMSPIQIAARLMDPVPEEVQFNILAGWRAEEIAAALPTSGLQVTGQEFLDLINHPPVDIIPASLQPLQSLEGFIMPGSYQVKRVVSAKDLVMIFLARFDEAVPLALRESYIAQGLRLPEAVTLASIVQREAVVVDEQPMIASVFYNRIAAGMKLESDPSVQYSLGYQILQKEWWKKPLSGEDLQFNSRYNTYVYPGLPPGPISNPSFDALKAVAYPAETGYYYFRAKCDGSQRHFFAVTYEEHLNNACP